MKKVGKFFINILKGIGIGISCMIPGVSGGTFALLTNCFDDIVFAVANIFKNFAKSILLLLPIFIGAFIGIAIGYFGISTAFEYILFSIISLFGGLISGSLPNLFKEARFQKGHNINYLALVLSALLVGGMGVIAFVLSLEYPHYSVEKLFINPQWYLYLLMIPLGAISALALVAPGLSGALILLVLGFYQPILDVLHNLIHFVNFFQNVGLIACFMVGVAIGFVSMIFIMKYMLSKHHSFTYAIIIGFIIGSLVAIFLNKDIYLGTATYPGLFKNPFELFVGIPLFVIGVLGSYFAIKFSNINKEKNATKEA